MADAPPPRRSGLRTSDAIARNASAELAGLWRTAQRLQRLTSCVRAVLPRDLAAQVQVAALQGGVLTLLVASAGWATRVRLSAGELAQQLRGLSDFQPLTSVRVRIEPGRDSEYPSER